jgi:hypothetical protein
MTDLEITKACAEAIYSCNSCYNPVEVLNALIDRKRNALGGALIIIIPFIYAAYISLILFKK